MVRFPIQLLRESFVDLAGGDASAWRAHLVKGRHDLLVLLLRRLKRTLRAASLLLALRGEGLDSFADRALRRMSAVFLLHNVRDVAVTHLDTSFGGNLIA